MGYVKRDRVETTDQETDEAVDDEGNDDTIEHDTDSQL